MYDYDVRPAPVITPEPEPKQEPPPITEQLETAPPEEAKQLVEKLTPQHAQKLQDQFDALPQGDKQSFANNMVDKLPGEQLSKLRTTLEGQGGGPVIDRAVQRSADEGLKTDYKLANAGVSDGDLRVLGLSKDDVKDVTKPVAEKLDSIASDIGNKDYAAATSKIGELKDQAAPLAREVLTNIVDKSSAPQAVKDFVKENGALIDKVISASPEAIESLAKGEFGQAIQDLAGNAGLRDQVVGALMKNDDIKAALQDLGNITRAQLEKAPPEVLDAIAKAASGDWKGAAVDLASAAADGNPLAKQAMTKAAQLVEGLPEPIKNILKDPALQDALAEAGGDSIKALLDGEPGKALDALTDPKLLKAFAQVALEQDPIKSAIAGLKLDPATIAQAGEAIPDIIKGIQQLHDGKPLDALKTLGGALLENQSPAVTKLLSDLAVKIGEKLPADKTATGQLLKSIVTDKALMSELIGNSDVHGALKDIFSGEVTEGLKAIGSNVEANQAIARHIATSDDPSTKALRQKLEVLGIKGEADIADIGPVLADAIVLGENIAKGKDIDLGAALVTLGRIATGLPEGSKAELMDKLVDPLLGKIPGLKNIPDDYKDFFKAALGGITNENVAKSLVDTFGKLPSDPTGFAKGLISTVKTLSENDDVALAMLNALGKINDGQSGVGAFFNNEDFNAQLVETDSVSSFFGAVEKLLVEGDIVGAVKELGGIIPKLIDTDDENFKIPDSINISAPGPIPGSVDVPIPVIGGKDLGFDQQGIENIGTLFKQFYGALPDSARTKIESKAKELAADITTGSLPSIGKVVDIASDVKSGVGELTSGDGDKLKGVFDLTSALAKTGSLIPPLKGPAAALGTIAAFGQTYIEVKDTVKTGLDIKEGFGL